MIDVASARLFLAALAGWFNRRQQEAVALYFAKTSSGLLSGLHRPSPELMT